MLDHVVVWSQAFFKGLRPRPDRPKVGTDVVFGTLNYVSTAALAVGPSGTIPDRWGGRTLALAAHGGLERLALLLVGHRHI
jgi:hypothetical protein